MRWVQGRVSLVAPRPVSHSPDSFARASSAPLPQEGCPEVHGIRSKNHSRSSSSPFPLGMARSTAAALLFIRVCGFVGLGSVLMAPSARAQPPKSESTTSIAPSKPSNLEVAKYRILQLRVPDRVVETGFHHFDM